MPAVQSASLLQTMPEVSAHDAVFSGFRLPRSIGHASGRARCRWGRGSALPQAWASAPTFGAPPPLAPPAATPPSMGPLRVMPASPEMLQAHPAASTQRTNEKRVQAITPKPIAPCGRSKTERPSPEARELGERL
jgi:hypothetical protein